VADYLAGEGALLEDVSVPIKGVGTVPVKRWTLATPPQT